MEYSSSPTDSNNGIYKCLESVSNSDNCSNFSDLNFDSSSQNNYLQNNYSDNLPSTIPLDSTNQNSNQSSISSFTPLNHVALNRRNLFPADTLNLSIMGSSKQQQQQHQNNNHILNNENKLNKNEKKRRSRVTGRVKKMSSTYVGCHWHNGAGK